MKEKLANLIKGVALSLLYILVFFSAQLILSVAAVVIIAMAGGEPETFENYTGWIYLFSSLMTLGICIISFYLRGKNLNNVIRTKNTSFLDAIFAFTMAIGFRLATTAYMLWAETVEPLRKSIEEAQTSLDTELMNGFDVILMLVAIWIIAPAIEEVVFRCIILEELRSGMPAFLAILIQGIAFGVIHGVLAQCIFTAVIGIVLGIVYYRTKNVVITVLVHLFFNCSAVLEIKDHSMIPQTATVGAVMIIISLIMFFVLHRKSKVCNL